MPTPHTPRRRHPRAAASRAERWGSVRAAVWLGLLCTLLTGVQLAWPSRPHSGDDLLTRLLRAALGAEGPALLCAALALFFYGYALMSACRAWRAAARR